MEKRRPGKATENSVTKKPRTLSKAGVARKGQRQDEAQVPRTLNVTLDLDALECPLCFSPFEGSIFQASSDLASSSTCKIAIRLRALARLQWQADESDHFVLTNQCKNGHAACEACCARVHRVCPSCIEPIGDIQCRPLENAIASMLVPCAFAEHGCTRRLRFAEKPVHEALLCQRAPCAWPVGGGGELGGLALSASGPVPCTRLWAGHHPTEAFLFVPDAYWGSSGSVSVTVHVRKVTADEA
ncbi:hypothetical protein C2845_PM07G02690 [Panicum miliaceum]|uniref:SIAH-type domain-containing protein n=1 Tax=Panicum miliaceum TaxID=4540 RepID=A0A3L6SLK3_PANMI|nr:hypothetical protein C2845_PM07G02690 [Panicum miliaceum]